MTAPDTPTHAPELAGWRLMPVKATHAMHLAYEKLTLWSDGDVNETEPDGPDAQAALDTLRFASPTPPVDVQALAEQVEALRKALEPFARFADLLSEETPGNIALGIFASGDMHFGPSGGSNVEALRCARAALNLTGGKHGRA